MRAGRQDATTEQSKRDLQRYRGRGGRREQPYGLLCWPVLTGQSHSRGRFACVLLVSQTRRVSERRRGAKTQRSSAHMCTHTHTHTHTHTLSLSRPLFVRVLCTKDSNELSVCDAAPHHLRLCGAAVAFQAARTRVPSQQPVPCVNAHCYCRCTYKMCTCIYYALHAPPQDPFHQAWRKAEGITRVLTMLPSRLPCPRRWCSRPRLPRAYTRPNAFRMRTPPPFSCPSRAPRPQGLPGTRPGAVWGPAARRPECSPR